MRQILLTTMLIIGLVENLSAYSIKFKTAPNHKGVYSIHIQCNNGSSRVVVYEPSHKYSPYFVDRKGSFKTLNNAASKACSKKITKLHRLKDNSLVCRSRNELRNLLSSRFSYDARKINLKYGADEGSCFLSSSSSTVKLLKKYSNESFPRPQDNGEKQWIENTKLNYDYYKVLSGRKTYYIGENEIQ